MSEKVNINPQEFPEAIPETKRRISIIWLLPIIAVAIGGWLFYKSIITAPVKVVIEFNNVQGITVDKTKVLYKGLPAGKVSNVGLSRKGDAVNVTVDFDPSLKHLIRQNTKFWIVTPTVNMTGVRGLGTIVSGNYIAMLPGDGPPASTFKALDGHRRWMKAPPGYA